ncbi:MAG TPA: hypothetical protein VFG83_00200 [Kofleriaceae bacterium]|nr:hypothetical protein [Kofleriaceae bacterium]
MAMKPDLLPALRRHTTTISTLGGQSIDSPRRLAEGSIPPPLPGLPPTRRQRRTPPPVPAEARDRTRYRARTVAWFREGDTYATATGATSIIDHTAEVPLLTTAAGTRALLLCLAGLILAAAVAVFAL